MADLTVNRIHETRRRGYNSYQITDGVTIGIGALVQAQTTGYLDHWDEAGEFLGILTGGDSRLNDGVIVGETSDTPIPRGRVDESGIVLEHMAGVGGSPTIANIGELIYCADSDTDNLTLTDTTNPPCGWMSGFISATDVEVTLFTPGEWLAGDAGATWAT